MNGEGVKVLKPVILIIIFTFVLNYSSAACAGDKIIAMDPMLSQWLLAFKRSDGIKDILITEVGKSEHMFKVFPDLKDNIMRKKMDNAESLILLDPKMIFIKTGTDHNYSELRKSGVEIIIFDFEKLEDIFKGVRSMGEKLKMEKRAERFIEYFKAAIDDAHNNFVKSGVEAGSIPRVYFANSNIYHSYGSGMYQNFLIETAGGKSVTSNASGSKIQVSIEELIKYDPEIIITASYCSDTPEMIMKNSKLKDLSAVKNKKIFVMPRYLSSWDMPVPESIVGILWLSLKINPKVNIDLNSKIKDFYLLFYNLKLDDSVINKILN